jgi:uncharacterized lipoprotein YmbA
MKKSRHLQLFALMCGLSLFAGGCLIKPARVPTRHFILAPIPPDYARAAAQPVTVEIGFVKMPSYLLRDSIIIRKSTDEIEYLEGALWAERLDQSFRQTLAHNLSLRLSSDRVYLTTPNRNQVMVRVSVQVEQFDVDTKGLGTLMVSWQVTAPSGGVPLKSGQTRLHRTGLSPLGNPQVIATSLSALTAEFSQELALAIRSSAPVKP